MAQKTRNEPKKFWNYADSKLKTKSRIPDLYVHPDSKELAENDQEKVDVLSNFYGSAYNKQSHDILPDMNAKDIW